MFKNKILKGNDVNNNKEAYVDLDVRPYLNEEFTMVCGQISW